MPSRVFLLCGEGLSLQSCVVTGWIHEAGLTPERFLLLGRMDQMEHVYPARTVAVLSSKSGEGFPNVLGEGMACGVPCVATDVGESAVIVGNTGRIVPPSDPGALSVAILDLLQQSEGELRTLGTSARTSIEERYSIAAAAAQYESLYFDVLGARIMKATRGD